MNSDVLELRARLRMASLSLLAAAGCASPDAPREQVPQSKVSEPVPVAVDGDKPKPEPPKPEPIATPIPELSLPSCPSGTWWGTLEEAKKRAVERKDEPGCPESIRGLVDAKQASQRPEVPGHAYTSLDVEATKALGEGQCSYRWTIPCPGGRPLLAEEGPRVAGVAVDEAWLVELAPGLELSEQLRGALAEGWLQDARSEHASVASFARATLELLALAAPPALVAACQRASLEEIEHALLCFTLAGRYAGAALGPGPLPAVEMRPAELVRLACDTFVEGCVGETIAALAAARAARRCVDPAVAGVLARIADDEAEHAALAWATVAWAVERGGEAVRSAVRALAAGLHAEVRESEPPAADVDAVALARHGRLDAAAQHACAVEAWQHLITDRVEALCGSSHGVTNMS